MTPRKPTSGGDEGEASSTRTPRARSARSTRPSRSKSATSTKTVGGDPVEEIFRTSEREERQVEVPAHSTLL